MKRTLFLISVVVILPVIVLGTLIGSHSSKEEQEKLARKEQEVMKKQLFERARRLEQEGKYEESLATYEAAAEAGHPEAKQSIARVAIVSAEQYDFSGSAAEAVELINMIAESFEDSPTDNSVFENCAIAATGDLDAKTKTMSADYQAERYMLTREYRKAFLLYAALVKCRYYPAIVKIPNAIDKILPSETPNEKGVYRNRFDELAPALADLATDWSIEHGKARAMVASRRDAWASRPAPLFNCTKGQLHTLSDIGIDYCVRIYGGSEIQREVVAHGIKKLKREFAREEIKKRLFLD